MNTSYKKKISILGSTGSIGVNTLRVVKNLYPNLQVVAISAKSNIELLRKQIEEFSPSYAVVVDEEKGQLLGKKVKDTKILVGEEALKEIVCMEDVDLVVSAIVGFSAIAPCIAAIKAKKNLALASKEVLIAAGSYIMNLARKQGVEILPLDSEHNAIFQCLLGQEKEKVRRVILTASGGPFLHHKEEELKKISIKQALNHPNWKMGPKVTVDCSTLMNKGLEVIEAHHLFDLPLELLDVVIHPQSLVHSFVEFIDGSLLAHVAEHDMAIPIQYALTHPTRDRGIVPCFDFQKYSKLEFFPPDRKRFPCLQLAFDAIKIGGSMTCFMNAANETLVDCFLKSRVNWHQIPSLLERVMGKHKVRDLEGITSVYEVDVEGREAVQKIIDYVA